MTAPSSTSAVSTRTKPSSRPRRRFQHVFPRLSIMGRQPGGGGQERGAARHRGLVDEQVTLYDGCRVADAEGRGYVCPLGVRPRLEDVQPSAFRVGGEWDLLHRRQSVFEELGISKWSVK